MRRVAFLLVAVVAVAMVVLGWEHLFPRLREASGLAFGGWALGLVGMGLLIGQRPRPAVRIVSGLILASVGLALMAMATDGQGILTGLRVGYVGALLAVMPHVWRQLRRQEMGVPRRRHTAAGQDVLS